MCVCVCVLHRALPENSLFASISIKVNSNSPRPNKYNIIFFLQVAFAGFGESRSSAPAGFLFPLAKMVDCEVSNAIPRATAPGLPVLPHQLYETLDTLIQDLNAWGRSNGLAFFKQRPSNYKDGKPTRYEIACDRGGKIHHTCLTVYGSSIQHIEDRVRMV